MSYNKISSREAGPFNNVKSTFHIDADNDGMGCDLSKSYLSLRVSCDTAHNNGFLNVAMVSRSNIQIPVHNTDLIKNVRITSKSKGLLVETRDVNMLAYQLKTITSSVQDNEGSEFNSLFTDTSPQDDRYGQFNQLFSGEHNYTENRDTRVNIPISHLADGFGSMKVSSEVLDGLEYKIDLDFSKVELQALNPLDNVSNVVIQDIATGNTTRNVLNVESFDILTQKYTTDNTTAAGQIPLNRDLPYYCGMPITIQYTPANGQATTLNTVISALSHNNSTEFAQIILADDIPANANDISINSITLNDGGYTPLLEVVEADLILYKIENPAMSRSYYTWETENDGFANTEERNNVYQLDRQCRAVIIKSDDTLYSGMRLGEEYELSIDGVRTTDEPVKIGQALHKEKMNQVGKNLNLVVKNMNSNLVNCSTNQSHKYLLSNHTNNIIMENVEVKEESQQLNLRLRNASGHPVSRLTVFKNMEKTI